MNLNEKKILVAPSTFCGFDDTPFQILKNNGFEIIKNKYKKQLNENQLLELSKDCIGIIAGTEKYSRKILKDLPRLRVISRLGVGMDNIDVEYAIKKNIAIFKTLQSPALAVAEMTVAHILNILRNVTNCNNNLKNGNWNKEMGSLFSGKTLGIIGLGAIGKELIKICKGFNLEVLAYDKFEDKNFADAHAVKYVNLNKLLRESDIISIHLNLSKDTDKLIDKNKLKKLKKDAVIINTARGEIIDEVALKNHLENKLIQGAGLDVFSSEPYYGKLTNLKNVILTPHISSYAKEIRIKMELESSNNLIKGLNEK